MAFNPGHKKVRLHLFVHSWQKNDVLGGIFEHLLTEGPHRVPESVVEFHLLSNCFLVSVLNLGA